MRAEEIFFFDEIYIEVTSNLFEIDTKTPNVIWEFPNEQTAFHPLQGHIVRWEADDENLTDTPILLYLGIKKFISGESFLRKLLSQ